MTNEMTVEHFSTVVNILQEMTNNIKEFGVTAQMRAFIESSPALKEHLQHITADDQYVTELENILASAEEQLFDISLEALSKSGSANDKPISTPRTPKYKGTETTPWRSVDKSFKGFVKAYYKRTGKKADNAPTQFSDCSAEMKQWIAEHSILGNPKAASFTAAIVLPVVNPMTGKLNGGGVSSANAYAEKVKGVSEETIKATKKVLRKLYFENFARKK